MRKLLSILLVAAGAAVFFYPHISGYYRDQRIEQGLDDFYETRAAPLAFAEEPSLEEGKEKSPDGPSPVAVLEIGRIDLELPVFQGTSNDSLDRGAGLLEEKAGIGEKGSAVVFAHRAHSYGRLFNRLGELEEGDRVVVESEGELFTYRVYSTGVYDAADASYLSCAGEKKRLVLVTCHPLYRPNPPYRLVVQAEMK